MNDDTKRTGANPASPAPNTVQDENLPAATIRRSAATAVVHLENNLLATASLLSRCRNLSGGNMAQELETMKTAVRLLRAQSDAADMLARVARGESRHRLTVEFAGTPQRELNSKFFSAPPPPAPPLASPEMEARADEPRTE